MFRGGHFEEFHCIASTTATKIRGYGRSSRPFIFVGHDLALAKFHVFFYASHTSPIDDGVNHPLPPFPPKRCPRWEIIILTDPTR